MNNIFENAYFGKPYKTRIGEKAVYLGKQGCWNYLVIKDTKFCEPNVYDDNGFIEKRRYTGVECEDDIVSEWQESINEEELDKLAKSICQYDDGDKFLYKHQGEYYIVDDLDIAFKAGYRKAMERYK